MLELCGNSSTVSFMSYLTSWSSLVPTCTQALWGRGKIIDLII